MADFREQIEEIKALLTSQDKGMAYVKLLRLQETSAVESSALETLAYSCNAILPSIILDISDSDEEIAAPALKCLGFMIYHPAIVASIGGDDAHVIIQSLVKVITTTKIKSVCNLGVWCVSVQQFSPTLLDQHFQPLLRAVTHALDNPIGSLSVTFEAMQAVVKLACLLTEKMRTMSSLWSPPIYRRLISVNKIDRDMSERCLLKIMPVICPPPIILSKALALDMKKKLLLAVKELLDQGMKIQSLQAWRWFIRLLGPFATKDKRLVNDMLKILEQTFSDFDSQVQIASLVAWEGLIDALIDPGFQAGLTSSSALGPDAQVLKMSECNNTQVKADRCSKIIKLIMSPIIGIMSSKCDVSVRASCLSTWSYLLHKLEASASCQSVIKTVWEPIIEVVFQVGPDDKNIWLWNFCLDLFDTLILGGNQHTLGNLYNQEPLQFSPKNSIGGHLASGKFFGSLLEAVQKSLRCVSISYDKVIHCLHTIFGFLERICKTSEVDSSSYYCPHTCLKFLKVVTERLEPSILESPLYKVGLEIKCSEKLERATEIRCPTVTHICFTDFEYKVLPIVYVGTLYFFVVVHFSMETPEYDSLLQRMEEYFKFLLSSCNPQEVLRAFTCLLYKNTTFNSLHIWVVLGICLKEFLDSQKDQPVLKMETDTISYSMILHLLSYPVASWSLFPTKLELQIVIDAWTSLYASVNQASQSVHSAEPSKSFSGDLCAMLNGCIDNQNALAVGMGTELDLEEEKCSDGFSVLCGNISICVLKQLTWSMSSKGRHYDGGKSNVANSMALAAWFMKLFLASKEETDPSHLSLASRFFSELANFVGCLQQKEDVLTFIEITSNPLLDWLSEMHLLNENPNYNLQILWTEMLKVLQRSRPSIEFESSFLKFQEPLLERALDHPNRAISEATINFWNSTYAAQNNLEFPRNIVPVLDKLSRNGKIKICSRNDQQIDSRLQRCKVTSSILRKCPKRVEIVGNPFNGPDEFDEKTYLGAKRRRSELTEHQKEVRRAQQGRARDCSGHGPGLRTYTSVDFSQGNEESQDSLNVKDAESI
ncbi:hypothetical protein OROHE_015058 [Orobanche hederae]